MIDWWIIVAVVATGIVVGAAFVVYLVKAFQW